MNELYSEEEYEEEYTQEFTNGAHPPEENYNLTLVDPSRSTPTHYIRKAEDALHTLKSVIEESGWKKVLAHKSGVIVYSKPGVSKENRLPVFMGQLEIEGFPPQSVFSVIGMRRLWDELYEEGNLVENLDDTTSLTYMVMHGMAGSKTRDFSLVEKVDCSTDGTIFFVSTSVITPKIPRRVGKVRANVKLNGWVLEPISESPPVTRVTYLLQSDVRGWIPSVFAKKYLARRPLVINTIKSYLQKNGSPVMVYSPTNSRRSSFVSHYTTEYSRANEIDDGTMETKVARQKVLYSYVEEVESSEVPSVREARVAPEYNFEHFDSDNLSRRSPTASVNDENLTPKHWSEVPPASPEAPSDPEEEVTEIPEASSDPEEEVTEIPEVPSDPEEEVTEIPESPSVPEEEVTEIPEPPSDPEEEVTEIPESPSDPEEEVTEIPKYPSDPEEEVTEIPESPFDPEEEVTEIPEYPSDPEEEVTEIPESPSDLEEEVTEIPEDPSDPEEEEVAEIPEPTNQVIVHRHTKSVQDAVKTLKSIYGNSGDWVLYTESKGVKVYTMENGRSLPIMRGDATYAGCTPDDVLSVVSNVGFRKLWDDRFEEGTTYERWSLYDTLSRSAMKGTFPVSGRDLALINTADRDPETGIIWFVSTSVVDQAIPATKKYVRAELRLAGWVLKPKKDSSGTIKAVDASYIVDIDIKLDSIPSAILKSISMQTPICAAKANEIMQKHGFPPYVKRLTGEFKHDEFNDKTFQCDFILRVDEGGVAEVQTSKMMYPYGFDVSVKPESVKIELAHDDQELIRLKMPTGIGSHEIKVKITKNTLKQIKKTYNQGRDIPIASPETTIISPTPKSKEAFISPTPKIKKAIIPPTPKSKEVIIPPTPKSKDAIISSTPKIKEAIISPTPKIKEVIISPTPKIKEAKLPSHQVRKIKSDFFNIPSHQIRKVKSDFFNPVYPEKEESSNSTLVGEEPIKAPVKVIDTKSNENTTPTDDDHDHNLADRRSTQQSKFPPVPSQEIVISTEDIHQVSTNNQTLNDKSRDEIPTPKTLINIRRISASEFNINIRFGSQKIGLLIASMVLAYYAGKMSDCCAL